MEIQLVFCSCSSPAEGSRLASLAVERHLAACASLLPGVRSWYRWQGRLEQAEECLLLLKTRSDRVADLTAMLKREHSYELPEILAVQAAGGLPAYLAWVADQACTTE
jgi:periplasmic divalent cation tolerance protein